MARQTKDINKDVIALVRQIQRLIPLLEAQVLTGLIDSGNTTDETLGAGGTFTGDWVLVGDRIQAAITIAVTAASAADGLVFQHSVDGSAVLHSHSYALTAGQSAHFDEPLLCDFFRVVYTDGGAGGDLDLQTKLFKSAPTAHAHALSDAFNAEHPANIVRSILSGFDVVGGLSKNVNSYQAAAGIVALLALLVDPSATALRFYTEDGAKAGNAVGIAPMGIRTDTLAAITPADGDWAPMRTNNKGAWWVALDGSVTISGIVTISGTVTANAGTGWAASGLATEVTLAAAAASLSVIDDWDETDRCKVNPIAGQAGVQGASGVVTALTQRVCLATDVALPAGTNAIGKLAANSGVDIGDVDVTSLPITEAVLSTAFSVTAAAPPSSTYATALSSDEWRWLEVINTTDTDFGISFNASTTHIIVPAGTATVIDLYSDGLKITAAVSYKYLTAPTRGTFYVQGLAV